jgi:hypothetical protein
MSSDFSTTGSASAGACSGSFIYWSAPWGGTTASTAACEATGVFGFFTTLFGFFSLSFYGVFF